MKPKKMANAIIQPIKAARTPEDMRLTPNSTFIRVYGMILLAEKMFQGCMAAINQGRRVKHFLSARPLKER